FRLKLRRADHVCPLRRLTDELEAHRRERRLVRNIRVEQQAISSTAKICPVVSTRPGIRHEACCSAPPVLNRVVIQEATEIVLEPSEIEPECFDRTALGVDHKIRCSGSRAARSSVTHVRDIEPDLFAGLLVILSAWESIAGILPRLLAE